MKKDDAKWPMTSHKMVICSGFVHVCERGPLAGFGRGPSHGTDWCLFELQRIFLKVVTGTSTAGVECAWCSRSCTSREPNWWIVLVMVVMVWNVWMRLRIFLFAALQACMNPCSRLCQEGTWRMLEVGIDGVEYSSTEFYMLHLMLRTST